MPTINQLNKTVNWDWEQHVTNSFTEANEGIIKPISPANFIEAGTILILAGPSDLDKATQEASEDGEQICLIPIGMIQSASIAQNSDITRLFEMGSVLSYLIRGRTVQGINIVRAFFDGKSLAKAVYMGEVKRDYSPPEKMERKFTQFYSSAIYENSTEKYFESSNISSNHSAFNLASRFFANPFGLAFVFKDHQKHLAGEIFCEGCLIGGHQISFDSRANVLYESIAIETPRIRPIVTAASAWEDGTDVNSLSDLADFPIRGLNS